MKHYDLDSRIAEMPNIEMNACIDSLASRRARGEAQHSYMMIELDYLKEAVEHSQTTAKTKLYAYHALAVHDPDDEIHAVNFANRITASTPRHLIVEAYALGRKATKEDLCERPDAADATISPLQAMMEDVILHQLSNGHYRQTAACELLGALDTESRNQQVPISTDKMNQFEEANNQAQVNRFWLSKKLYDANMSSLALNVVHAYDTLRGGTLTSAGKQDKAPQP